MRRLRDDLSNEKCKNIVCHTYIPWKQYARGEIYLLSFLKVARENVVHSTDSSQYRKNKASV